MTVTELIDRIIAAYPGASAEAMATFKPVFHARFSRREGPHLQAAFEATLAHFKATARQPFPIPADIEAHMPSVSLSTSGGGKLDFAKHRERKNQLLWNWKAQQGDRASRGVHRIMQALMHIAEPLADLRGWKENPEPIVLTREQMLEALMCAVSARRRELHGPPPRSAELFWEQITGIATEWGVTVNRDNWTAPDSTLSPKAEEAA